MPYRFRVLALLFFLVLVMYLDRLCIAVAGPRMQRDLGIAPSQWGWIIGAFTLFYAIFEIPSGILGDRIGPRKVLTRIVLWWSLFTALTGSVSSIRALLLVRFLFGAGEAGAFPNCASAVSRWSPLRERARATSVIWMATAVGGALTPLIVVWIEQRYSWRFAFVLFGALGLFWAGLWYWWFRDSPADKRGITARELSLIGAVRTRGHAGVNWPLLLRNRNFQLILIMYHTYCWGAYFYLSWLPTYLQVGRGLSEDQMKFAAALPSLGGLAGIVGGGYLSDRLARRYSLRIARCSIGATGLILSGVFLAAAALTVNNVWMVGWIALGLVAMDAMLPVAWSLCIDVGKEHAGAVSAAMNMSGQAGSLISSVAFGYWVERIGYNFSLLPLAAMLIVSGSVFAWIDPGQSDGAG